MSLYEQLKKDNARCLKTGKDYLVKSRLLEDFKDGKEPQKKHVTLDNFFKDSKILVVLND